MSLTKHDRECGPEWMIIATRIDGAVYVLEEVATERLARRRCKRLAKHLEGVRVTVERIGERGESVEDAQWVQQPGLPGALV